MSRLYMLVCTALLITACSPGQEPAREAALDLASKALIGNTHHPKRAQATVTRVGDLHRVVFPVDTPPGESGNYAYTVVVDLNSRAIESIELSQMEAMPATPERYTPTPFREEEDLAAEVRDRLLKRMPR
jgi:hypothetical protein